MFATPGLHGKWQGWQESTAHVLGTSALGRFIFRSQETLRYTTTKHDSRPDSMNLFLQESLHDPRKFEADPIRIKVAPRACLSGQSEVVATDLRETERRLARRLQDCAAASEIRV